MPDDFDAERYDMGYVEIQANEEEALQLFSLLETADTKKIIDFIDQTGIPAWEKNILVLNELDQIEGLYPEFIDQNKTFRAYCNIQVETYQLIRKAVLENTDQYDAKIEKNNLRVEALFE